MRFPAAAPVYVGSIKAAVARQERRWPPKPVYAGAIPARRAANVFIKMGPWLDKEGTCLASRLMREHYPPAPPFFRTAEREAWRLSGLISRASGFDSHFRYHFRLFGSVDR